MGNEGVNRYVRYELAGSVAYGMVDGESVCELNSAPFEGGQAT